MNVILKIGRARHSAVSIADAQMTYERVRDESGKGASTFPTGKLTVEGDPRKLIISYNGRVWDTDGNMIAEVAR